MRPKYVALALLAVAPFGGSLTACSNSVAPAHATSTADTILADVPTLAMLTVDSVGTDTDTTGTFGLQQLASQQSVEWSFTPGTPWSAFSARSVMRFALPVLSGRRVVDSARVWVFQCGVVGNNQNSGSFDPYSGGHITIDHVALPEAMLSSATLFFGDTLGASLGTISSDSAVGYRSMSVTDQVLADYTAKRSSSQYRLNWIFDTAPVEGSAQLTYTALFGSACNAASGPGPFLVIWSH